MLIIIRVDASQQIGSGHVMRCLTLAKALNASGATVEFITRPHQGNLNEHIKCKGFKVNSLPDTSEHDIQQSLNGYEQWLSVNQEIDAEDTIQVLTGVQADWLIIDHYALDHIWEEKLRSYTKKTMVIDDLSNRSHNCDLLLDQNYTHDQSRYDPLLSPETIKLLGPKYALLRYDFVENRLSIMNNHGVIKRVFIFFGGTDHDNLTTTALKALAQSNLKHLSVDVIIGSTNPHFEEIKAQVEEQPTAEYYIQVENVAELMTKADIALGAGGTTTWERMAVGLPSIVVTIAENQVTSTRDLDQDGYLKWLGNVGQVDESKIHNALLEAIQNPHRLRDQSRKGQQLVGGMGVQIIAKLLTVGPDAATLVARRAEPSDCLLYWYWVNDPVVRENAFNQQSVGWEDHQAWFDKQLINSDTILLLIECDYGPVGQVRFDRTDLNFMVDYSIGNQFRGFGLGKGMLAKAIDYLRHEQSFTLIGDVKETNIASRKVFEQLGFRQSVSLSQKGVFRYLLKCPRTTDNEDVIKNRSTFTTVTKATI